LVAETQVAAPEMVTHDEGEARCVVAPSAAHPLFFFFHRDGHGTDRRQANPVSFHVRDKAPVDEVVVTPVMPLAAVLPGQLDAVAFDSIDRANVNAIGADDFHMFPDLGHVILSSSVEPGFRSPSDHVNVPFGRPLSGKAVQTTASSRSFSGSLRSSRIHIVNRRRCF
jgi:hypothetical protein